MGVIRGAEEYLEGGCSGPAAAILDSVCVEAAGPGWLAAPLKSSLTTAFSASPPHATRREHVAGVTNTVPGALTGVWRPGGGRGVCQSCTAHHHHRQAMILQMGREKKH